jgi:chaperonin GroES
MVTEDFLEPIHVHAFELPDVDPEACRILRPFRHVVVVEMCRKAESFGTVLASYSNELLGPDCGVVIGVGAHAARELKVGDLVLVNHAHGKHMRPFRVGGVGTDGEVRFYGCAAVVGGKSRLVPWWKSVMAVMDGDEIRPTGSNVLIDRGDVVESTSGGILLPDDAKYRPTIGRVVAKGPQANPEIRVGSTVVYMATLVKRVEGVGKNLGIVPSDAVLAEVGDE